MPEKIKCGIIKRSKAFVLKYILALGLYFCFPPLAQSQPPPDYNSLIKKLKIDFETPGMAVAIVENHHWAEYVVGVSNIET